MELRFLHAEGVGLTPESLRKNGMLVYLNLAGGGLLNLGDLDLPYLLTLDVSYNRLHAITNADLNVLRSVRDLSLAGNPLSTYLNGLVAVNWTLPRLQRLDLSDVALAEVDLQTMRMFHTVQALNMTRCGLQRLLGSGFQSMKQLRVLDVRGSALSVLDVRGSALSVLDVRGSALSVLDVWGSALSVLDVRESALSVLDVQGSALSVLDVRGSALSVLDVRGSALSVLDERGSALSVFAKGFFQGLDELDVVYADNYKLCCPGVVPDGFNAAHCHAPSDGISSCQALLRSSAYRGILAVFSTLSIVGNGATFLYRVVIQRTKSKQGFGVFVSHLCVADFLMGVYLALIGVADRMYQRTYLWNEATWRHSPVCKVAGLCSLLSSEVSAVIICLITLDRFLVLRFPFSRFHFQSASAYLACALTSGLWGWFWSRFPCCPSRPTGTSTANRASASRCPSPGRRSPATPTPSAS